MCVAVRERVHLARDGSSPAPGVYGEWHYLCADEDAVHRISRSRKRVVVRLAAATGALGVGRAGAAGPAFLLSLLGYIFKHFFEHEIGFMFPSLVSKVRYTHAPRLR